MSISHIIKSSAGNDSIALVAWKAAECRRTGQDPSSVLVVHNDTGWASGSWPARVKAVTTWCESLGFQTRETRADGMAPLILGRGRGMPPQNGRAFCSIELKILPSQEILDEVDPECEAVILIGKRRNESRARATTPSWIEGTVDGETIFPDTWQQETTKDERLRQRLARRSIHHPLVTLTASARDELLPPQFPSFSQACVATGQPVPDGPGTRQLWAAIREWCEQKSYTMPYRHRSRECVICVPHANKDDLALLTEPDIQLIEDAGRQIRDKYPNFTWQTPRRRGGARTIRELVEWGRSARGGYRVEQMSICDLGWCDVD